CLTLSACSESGSEGPSNDSSSGSGGTHSGSGSGATGSGATGGGGTSSSGDAGADSAGTAGTGSTGPGPDGGETLLPAASDGYGYVAANANYLFATLGGQVVRAALFAENQPVESLFDGIGPLAVDDLHVFVGMDEVWRTHLDGSDTDVISQ